MNAAESIGGAGPIVRLEQVAKHYGRHVALHHIDLDVAAGEFVTLLGPSGCGKTTTLRTISGFEAPTRGEIYLAGNRITHTPAHRRRVNTVFQSYALFPHMSVVDNVGYGLRFDGVGRAQRRQRALEMLETVGLADRGDHRPDALSGGQMQRVALARALIKQPEVLLLDEPLSALDARLRKELQLELKRTQRDSGITFIYVTHDQEEALAMSDRIAVMNQGRIEQIGTPKEVFEHPETLFVARFIGASNELEGTARAVGDETVVTLDSGESLRCRPPSGEAPQGPVRLIVRPEHVVVADGEGNGDNCLSVVLDDLIYLGVIRKLLLRRSNGQVLEASVPASALPESIGSVVGREITISLPRDSLLVFSQSDVEV